MFFLPVNLMTSTRSFAGLLLLLLTAGLIGCGSTERGKNPVSDASRSASMTSEQRLELEHFLQRIDPQTAWVLYQKKPVSQFWDNVSKQLHETRLDSEHHRLVRTALVLAVHEVTHLHDISGAFETPGELNAVKVRGLPGPAHYFLLGQIHPRLDLRGPTLEEALRSAQHLQGVRVFQRYVRSQTSFEVLLEEFTAYVNGAYTCTQVTERFFANDESGNGHNDLAQALAAIGQFSIWLGAYLDHVRQTQPKTLARWQADRQVRSYLDALWSAAHERLRAIPPHLNQAYAALFGYFDTPTFLLQLKDPVVVRGLASMGLAVDTELLDSLQDQAEKHFKHARFSITYKDALGCNSRVEVKDEDIEVWRVVRNAAFNRRKLSRAGDLERLTSWLDFIEFSHRDPVANTRRSGEVPDPLLLQAVFEIEALQGKLKSIDRPLAKWTEGPLATTRIQDCEHCPTLLPLSGAPPELPSNADAARSGSTRVGPPYISETPITHAQWVRVMGFQMPRAACSNKPDSLMCPVAVTYLQAQAFIGRLNVLTGRTYRLPDEAQWLQACLADQLGHCGERPEWIDEQPATRPDRSSAELDSSTLQSRCIARPVRGSYAALALRGKAASIGSRSLEYGSAVFRVAVAASGGGR